MKINFSKYNGAGNDFIIIDDRDNNVHLTKSDIYNLCNRNIGIGGDGLIIIKKSIKTNKYFLFLSHNQVRQWIR